MISVYIDSSELIKMNYVYHNMTDNYWKDLNRISIYSLYYSSFDLTSDRSDRLYIWISCEHQFREIQGFDLYRITSFKNTDIIYIK